MDTVRAAVEGNKLPSGWIAFRMDVNKARMSAGLMLGGGILVLLISYWLVSINWGTGETSQAGGAGLIGIFLGIGFIIQGILKLMKSGFGALVLKEDALVFISGRSEKIFPYTSIQQVQTHMRKGWLGQPLPEAWLFFTDGKRIRLLTGRAYGEPGQIVSAIHGKLNQAPGSATGYATQPVS